MTARKSANWNATATATLNVGHATRRLSYTPLVAPSSTVVKTAKISWFHLVFVAYSLLHLDCLPPSLNQDRLPIKTIGEACRQQAQALIEALILQTHEHLQQGQEIKDVFAHLFAKQQVVAVA